MRIRRSLSFIAKQITKTALRKTATATLSIAIIAGGVMVGQNVLTTPNAANAIVAPEACFAFTTDANEVTITDYYDIEGNALTGTVCPRAVDIPSSLGGNPVVTIGTTSYPGPFRAKYITSVTIPSGVTSIGDAAFSNNELTDVTMSNGVAIIGDDAFSYNQLTSVTIPSSVTNIGRDAFSGNQLTSVAIPSGVTSIGDSAFSYNQLTSVTIPSSVTSIGHDAFFSNQLTSVAIPSGVTSIGNATFSHNQLTSVAIPSGVTSIGDSAFSYNKLTTVTVPDSVISIEPNSFAAQSLWGSDINAGANGAPNVNSGDPTEAQSVYDNVWYVRLYTANPANMQQLSDSAVSEASVLYSDNNSNGTLNDSLGGHIVNPAHATVNTVDMNDNIIQSAEQFSGIMSSDGSALIDYRAAAGGAFAPLNPQSLTFEEQTIMDTGFAQYHRIGQIKQFTAPTIAGYTLVSPVSPASVALNAANNTLDFRYEVTGSTPASISLVDFSTPVGSATNPTPGSVPSGLPEIMAGSTFSTDTAKECSAIKSASLLPASDFASPVNNYTTLGGLEFVIDCTTPGGDANVIFTLGAVVPDLAKAKVYKKTTAGVATEITSQVTLANKPTSQGERTVISYSLTDGGALDDDRSVNGSISDPIYITVPSDAAEALLGVPNTGMKTLADIGSSVWMYAVAGMAAILAIIGAMVRRRAQSETR